MKRVLTVAALFLVPAMLQGQTDSSGSPIQFTTEKLDWVNAPSSAPAGSKMILLEGNPSSDGLYTIRLKIPAGTKLPPHTHPQDERVTVLSGEVRIGFGERADNVRMTVFRAGSYYVNPAGVIHHVWFPLESIIQITGFGPWKTEFLRE